MVGCWIVISWENGVVMILAHLFLEIETEITSNRKHIKNAKESMSIYDVDDNLYRNRQI